MSTQQLYIREPGTGRIRLTSMAVERYRERFARAGFHVEDIRTLEQFEAAIDAMFRREMEEYGAESHGIDPELDRVLDGLPGWDA